MKKSLITIASIFVLAGNVYAEDLAVPHSFSSGNTIKSSEVNENFTTIYQKFNEMQTQLAALQASVSEKHPSTVITVSFNATVSTIDDMENVLSTLDTPIAVGDTITGQYTYDTSTSRSDGVLDPSIYTTYDYKVSGFGMTANIGSHTINTDQNNVNLTIVVADNESGNDTYNIISNTNITNTTFSVSSMNLHFGSTTGDAISSTDLVATPPVLANWEAAHTNFNINGCSGSDANCGSGNFSLRATINSVSLVE